MLEPDPEHLGARLVETLYSEALLLADEARGYFNGAAREDRERLDPLTRVGMACESLRVTTRLMHVLAWLLARRGGTGGEPAAGRPLGQAPAPGAEMLERLPETARDLVMASVDLHARVQRLDGGGSTGPSPARALMSRLERAF